jgi:phage terminase small subunit
MILTPQESLPQVDGSAVEELKHKIRVFCVEYCVDFNGAAAAVRAGYTKKNAKVTAARLLTNDNVCQEIARLMQERIEKVKTDSLYILQRLKDELEADVADLYDAETGCLKDVHDMPAVWRKGLIAGIETEEILSGPPKARVKTGEVKKIKLSDRAKRIELLGRHVDVNAWKQDESGKEVASAMADFWKQVSGNVLGPVVMPRQTIN